jgi:hypothetical protein
MRVIAASTYERRAARLLSAERTTAEAEITARPDVWPVIPGTGGAREARIALPGRGKRGGARVICFFSMSRGVIAFFDIYAKSVKENLTGADKRDLKAAIAEITAAVRADSTR